MGSDKKSAKAALLRPMVLIPAVVALVAAGTAGGAAMAWQADIETTEHLKAEQAELTEAIVVREREIAEAKAAAERLARAEAECAAVTYDKRDTLRADIVTLPYDVRQVMEAEVCPRVFQWMDDSYYVGLEIFDSITHKCEWHSGTKVRYKGKFTNTSDVWTVDVRFEARFEDKKDKVVDSKQLEYLSVAPGETTSWSATLNYKNNDEGTCIIYGEYFTVWPSDL